MTSEHELLPIPDPSKLTTEQLVRSLLSAEQLTEEKFKRVYERFDGNDKAVSAAFDAQKQAAEKSEQATTKQIDGLAKRFEDKSKSDDERIAAINERLNRGEGSVSGASGNREGLLKMAGVVIAALALALTFMAYFK